MSNPILFTLELAQARLRLVYAISLRLCQGQVRTCQDLGLSWLELQSSSQADTAWLGNKLKIQARLALSLKLIGMCEVKQAQYGSRQKGNEISELGLALKNSGFKLGPGSWLDTPRIWAPSPAVMYSKDIESCWKSSAAAWDINRDRRRCTVCASLHQTELTVFNLDFTALYCVHCGRDNSVSTKLTHHHRFPICK